MAIHNTAEIGQTLDALGGQKRLTAFDLLAEGESAPAVAEEIDISRSGLQPYLDDYRDNDLLEKTDRGFVTTEKGERVHEWLEELDGRLEQFLIGELEESARKLAEHEGLAMNSKTQDVLRELLDEAEGPSESDEV